MSGGDRGAHSEASRGGLDPQEQSDASVEQTSANPNATTAAPRAKRPIAVRVVRALKRRRHQSNTKTEKEHRQNERAMALWAVRVGYFTIVLAVCAILNVIILGFQWSEMHAGGVDTHNLAVATGNLVIAASGEEVAESAAASAAASEAIAMDKLRKITQGEAKVALATEAPQLSVDAVSLSGFNGKPATADQLPPGMSAGTVVPIYISLHFTNIGSSVANIQASSINTIYAKDFPKIPVFGSVSPMIRNIKSNDGFGIANNTVFSATPIADIAALRGFKVSPFFYGYIDYADFLGDIRRYCFAYRLTLPKDADQTTWFFAVDPVDYVCPKRK